MRGCVGQVLDKFPYTHLERLILGYRSPPPCVDMDIFGTVGTAVALLEVGGKLIVALRRFRNDVRHAEEDIEGLIEQVQRIDAILGEFRKVYKEAQDLATELSASGCSSQADWFTQTAKEMKRNVEEGTLKRVITDCKNAYDELTELLKLDLSVEGVVGPGPQAQSSNTNSQVQSSNTNLPRTRTSLWRLMMKPKAWKPYFLWLKRRKKVEAMIENFRRHGQDFENVNNAYQE